MCNLKTIKPAHFFGVNKHKWQKFAGEIKSFQFNPNWSDMFAQSDQRFSV